MAVAAPAVSVPELAVQVDGNLHGGVGRLGSASSGHTNLEESLSYSARTNASCSTVTEPIAMHSLVANLLAHDARLQTQSRLAKELEAELEGMKNSAVQMEIALAKANVTIHEREVDLADANMVIHEHEGEIHRLREELDFVTSTGSDWRRQLQERDAEISRLRVAAQAERVNEHLEHLQSRVNKFVGFERKLRNRDAFVRQLEVLANLRGMDDSPRNSAEASPDDWRLLMHELGLSARYACGGQGQEDLPGDDAAVDHDAAIDLIVQQVSNGVVDPALQDPQKGSSDAVTATGAGDSVAAVARHRCEDVGSSRDASFMQSAVSGETPAWMSATTDEHVKDDAGYEAQMATSHVPALPTLRLQSPPVNQAANLASVAASHDNVDPSLQHVPQQATSLSARASQALSRANSDCSMASSVAGAGLAPRAVPTSLTPRPPVRAVHSPKGEAALGWMQSQHRAVIRGSSPTDLARTGSQNSVGVTDEERGTLISWAYAPQVDSPVAKGRASGNRVDDKIAEANGVKHAGIASSKASHTQSLGSLGSPPVRTGPGGPSAVLTVLRQQPRTRASTGNLQSAYQRFPLFGTNGTMLGATPTGSPSSSPSPSPLRRVIVAPPPVVTQSASSSLASSRRTL